MDDSVEEIKNRLDLKEVIEGYLRLQKSGANYRALCPFHKEKTPSLFISPTRQVWRCFGCGEGGDMFTFIEQIEGVEFAEALRTLANRAGVELKRQDPRVRSEKNRSLEICDLAAKYFNYQLESKNGKLVSDYLKDRGINEKSIEEFSIGYAPHGGNNFLQFFQKKGYSPRDLEKAGLAVKLQRSGKYVARFRGRIVFPIFNINSGIIGFGGRKLTEDLANKMEKPFREDTAKYINTPQTNIYDKSKVIYGLDKAKIHTRQEDACIITEGYTDVILAHQNGYKNVVASSGTALTQEQLSLIKRFTSNIFTAFDMDIAGDTATKRGIELAQEMGMNVKVISLPEDADPADIIQEDPKKWEKSLDDARSIPQYYIDSAFSRYDASTPEGKREIGRIVAPILKSMKSRIEQSHWVQDLAKKLEVSEDDVWEEVKNATTQKSQIQHNESESKQQSRNQRSRKELLQEQILSHVLLRPKRAKAVVQYMNSDKEETSAARIIDIIAKQKSTKRDSVLKKLEKDDRELADQLLLEAEVKGLDTGDAGDGAFDEVINEYRKLILDEELKYIEQTIKKNEEEGNNDKNKQLLKEFQDKAKERTKLT